MKKIITLTLIAILIPFIVFAFLGCVKNPDHKPNFGEVTSLENIQLAMKEAMQDFAPPQQLLIKKGQFIYLETVQTIDSQSPLVIMQRGDTILDTATDAQFLTLSFDIQLAERQSDNTMAYSRFPSCLRVENTTGEFYTCPEAVAPLAATEKPVYTSPFPLPDLSFAKMYKKQISPFEKVTYHNLKKAYGLELYPDLVRQRPNCGGAANCETGMKFMMVQYDAVLWDTDDHGMKTTVQYFFSADVPTYIYDWANQSDIFPNRIYRECIQQWIRVENEGVTREVPVRQCRQLKDFKFGT